MREKVNEFGQTANESVHSVVAGDDFVEDSPLEDDDDEDIEEIADDKVNIDQLLKCAGGKYRRFTSSNSDLVFSWNCGRGFLSFQRNTGDCLKEPFINI